MKKIIISVGVYLFFGTCCAVFKLGIESIDDVFVRYYKHDKIGLVTNQTGIDQHHHRSVDVLLSKGFNIVCLLAPEHGINGTVLAAKNVDDVIDKRTGMPIVSLYGHGTGKTVNQAVLDMIDTFMIDLQDCGMRHYTYISTMATILKAAAKAKKRVVIFDRPNPLGAVMEGPLVEPSLHSFISIASIPLRHGLTMGELARYFNKYLCEGMVDLRVVPMRNYSRKEPVVHLLAPLSPNIRSIESCKGYSFLGLLGEVYPLYNGVGTHQAFTELLIPVSYQISDQQWRLLRGVLRSYGIESTLVRHIKKDVPMIGLTLIMHDMNQVNAFSAFCAILKFMKKNGVRITLSNSFDKAVGSSLVRSWINDEISTGQLSERLAEELRTFYRIIHSICLYEPLPKLCFLDSNL